MLMTPMWAQTFTVVSNVGAGTISVTNGTTGVTGVGTNFTSSWVGAPICNTALTNCGIVSSVGSTTSITLTANWAGTTLTTASYATEQICHAATNASITVSCPSNFQAGNVLIGAAWIDNTTTNLIVTPAYGTNANGVRMQLTSGSPFHATSGTGLGSYWLYYTPYVFSGTNYNSVTFTGNPVDTPDDVWVMEVAITSGYHLVFDTDGGAFTTGASNPSATLSLANSSGEFVMAVSNTTGGKAFASPLTTAYISSTNGAWGYLTSTTSSSVTATFSTAGNEGAQFAGAWKLVANTNSGLSGNATLTGNTVFNAANSSSTIAAVCTPTVGTSTSGTTATTGTCNSAGATLEVCSVAWGSATATITFVDSLSNTWQHTQVATHTGDGSEEIYWVFNPTTGSAQTFSATPSASTRHTIACRAYSGTLTTAAVLDQQPTTGFGAGASCAPTLQIPAVYGDLGVTGFTGNGLSGTSIAVSNPFSTYTVQLSNTSVWDSGYADSIMTIPQPASPSWSISGDSGLNCVSVLFRP